MYQGGFTNLVKPEPDKINESLTWEGDTYLHELCSKNAPVELIREAVLTLGADINVLNKKKWPPLGLAILGGHVDVVQCLLDLGAKLYFPTDEKLSFNAASVATFTEREEVLKVVLNHGGGLYVNVPGTFQPGRDELPCLAIAVRNYSHHTLEMLVNAGAFLNQESGGFGMTPLQLVSASNWIEPVKKLISLGAELDYPQSSTGMTALHYAVREEKRDIVEYLLQKGANPDARTADGYTPLMLCIHQGNPGILDILLKAKADVNGKRAGNKNETVLHTAALRGNNELVNALLEKGADPLLTDAFNHTARHYAYDSGYYSLAAVLKEAENRAEQKYFEKAYQKLRHSP